MLIALLDSNQLILHVNGEHVLRFDPGSVAISVLTVFECLRLPGMLESEEREMTAVIELCDVVSVSKEIAARAAVIARTRKNARPIDLIIAATALELGVPLVTKNLKDFKRIPELVVHSSLGK